MINWIVWNKTVLTFKLYNYAEIELFWHLIVCKSKTVLMLKWIVWDRTIYMFKNGFGIK